MSGEGMRVVVVVVVLLIGGVFGWGKDGHYAVCKIAQGFLSEDALTQVKALLPDRAEGDLASVCSWADEIKHNYRWRWSSPLHYVDTPDFWCNYKFRRDCHDSAGHKDRCVTAAIYNYTKQLDLGVNNLNSEFKYNLTEALMFLSHFVGDVHQPLHVGFVGDEGGNTIIVRWYRRKSSLHHVWDNMIIESSLKTFYNSDLGNLIQAIQSNITIFTHRIVNLVSELNLTQAIIMNRQSYQNHNDRKNMLEDDGWFNDSPSWGNCTNGHMVCPDPYASESIDLACKFAYRNATPGSTLGDDYFLSRLPIVEKRLAQAGVRLAATLNRIFAPVTSVAQE